MAAAYRAPGQIITSLLDTDWYKLTMMQGVHHKYPNANVAWEFRCRNAENLAPYLGEIRDQIDRLASLALSRDESTYLSGFPYLSPDFIRFLELYRFRPEYVSTYMEGSELCIVIDGPWSHSILFEIVILAIISEVRNRVLHPGARIDEAVDRLRDKLAALRRDYTPAQLADFRLADFGTRRRLSQPVQEAIIGVLAEEFPGQFVGTSNVDIARRHGLAPMGTMAHEWVMAHQQLGSRLVDSQRAALEAWVQEYRGHLGVALTDTITLDAFLADFDLYFAKLFDGLRHDSGDPLVFAEKCIRHYERLGIDPRGKTLIFSDALTFDSAMAIKQALKGRIRTSFGIGTSLTCDLPGVTPMNIVIKMVSCNGQPVAKISDAPGKASTRDPEYVHYLRSVFNVEEPEESGR
ncbi:nicotinate phosphoribosyltransferase [Halomonas sp. KAO]|uniref:nicotinate phosphoribosyltransferase n=1 Tax=unclassified Halomonas TaxID=2609666 RepID=UPI00189ED56E|nr:MULTISPECIES: nicotinate phosphoribosyltransferase [unclassified Halomonas]MBF7054972.1 nicotinate phosphoribosyltransferase [Halomonas sp. KAO]MDT0501439.1 nicotinate phosphoribosyltransferase [Halomonas sp. PAR7]MDT0512887.1 nicotinate phosphoribosyltransferase [Halomonas sp. LES1]MDT0591288.1 nicotinate phosphoribosyltransferase [Halomonas sp. PAR8]